VSGRAAPRAGGRREAVSTGDDLDRVWKALADPTRRAILDLLRAKPRTTTEIAERIPDLSRFGVMKHLAVLRGAGLVQTREEGRSVVNSLNVVPIRLIYERWVSDYQDLWVRKLTGLKRSLENGPPEER
jgi:DNA-binding transcriptional ArsR family regulator